MTKRRIVALYREADAVLNICGTQEFNEDLLQSNRILYVESDPGVEQIKVDQGAESTIDYLGKHHALFTFGENVGTEKFPVPAHGLRWMPDTPADCHRFVGGSRRDRREGAIFTTVANWSTSGLKDMEWRGEKYLWSKSLEFLKFVAAPRRSGEVFELATTIKDKETFELFVRNRWRFVSPVEMSIDYDSYVGYLQNSKGEFTVAKDQYVRLNTGWFSDRSACYLAAGRPVITQETGFTSYYGGAKKGLFSFSTVEEIAEAVEMINSDYTAHSRAAREIAQENFESGKVLVSMLERAGI